MRARIALLSTVSLALGALGALAAITALGVTDPAPNPTFTADPVTIALEVRQLARLETASVTAQKVIRANRGGGQLWGVLDENLLLVATGEVVAGIDLDQVAPEHVRVEDGGEVWIHLPEPTVWRVDLDERATWVAHRDRGWLARVDRDLESEARRAAERELRSDALRMGILEEARAGAERALTDLLRDAGVATVHVAVGEPTAT